MFNEIAKQALLPMFGVLLGAWLSSSFFPFKLKIKQLTWEKELWAKETFYESISRINFLISNHVKEEYEDRFSMSSITTSSVEREVSKEIKSLHEISYKIKIYLRKKDLHIFENYLAESQSIFDEAKSSYGSWYQGDIEAENNHSEEILYRHHVAVTNALNKLSLPV